MADVPACFPGGFLLDRSTFQEVRLPLTYSWPTRWGFVLPKCCLCVCVFVCLILFVCSLGCLFGPTASRNGALCLQNKNCPQKNRTCGFVVVILTRSPQLGPPVVPFYQLFGGRVPHTKIDKTKKSGYPFSSLSNLQGLVK